jgi:hypothetical protein
MEGSMSPGVAVDAAVSRFPAWLRGWGAILTVLVTVFSLGFAAGSWGVRNQIVRLDLAVEDLQRADKLREADVATNRSDIASIRATVTQAELATMAERIRRMDRMLCISVENLSLQECARR